MTAQIHQSNHQAIARLTGLAYLGIVGTGLFAEFFVRMSVVVPGDAVATTTSILNAAQLFRAGLAADALMIALDVCVAVGFYVLLRHVHRPLALLAAALRLVQACVLGANMMNMAGALNLATASNESSENPGMLQGMVLAAMDLHRVVYDLGLVFFGLSCLVLGRLIWTSRSLPRWLGLGLAASGAVYLVGSFCVILAPELAAALDPMYGFTVLAELAVAFFLVVKGVRPEGAERSSVSSARGLAAAALLLSAVGCGTTDGTDTTPVEAEQPGTEPSEPHLSLQELGERGEYAVGHRRFEEAGSELSIQAWYPTFEEEGRIEYEVVFQADYYGAPTGVIVGRAAREAELAETGAPLPVVVFSHGFSLNPEWYSALTEHLASHGFVVLAPNHPEADWDAHVVDASFDRPERVRQTIDLAEGLADEGAWQGRLDVTQVAVVGHSAGGYTALAAGGARFDAEALADDCADLDPTDPKTFLCAPFSANAEVVERFEMNDDAPSPVQDERVAAVVSIAGDAYLFGEQGLAALTVPTLAIGGTGDNYSPWEWGTELTFESVGSERAVLVGLEAADHMVAVNDCGDMPWTDALPDEFAAVVCQDPAWERAAAHAVIQRFGEPNQPLRRT